MPPRPPPASTEAFPSLLLTPRTSPHPLHLPSLPLDPVPSSALSLHAPERSSSSPTPFVVATVLPTATRSTQEIRLDHLFLLAEKRTAGAPATSPPLASSTSGPPAIFVKFAGSGPSPTSPSVPRHPRESLLRFPSLPIGFPCSSHASHHTERRRPPWTPGMALTCCCDQSDEPSVLLAAPGVRIAPQPAP